MGTGINFQRLRQEQPEKEDMRCSPWIYMNIR